MVRKEGAERGRRVTRRTHVTVRTVSQQAVERAFGVTAAAAARCACLHGENGSVQTVTYGRRIYVGRVDYTQYLCCSFLLQRLLRGLTNKTRALWQRARVPTIDSKSRHHFLPAPCTQRSNRGTVAAFDQGSRAVAVSKSRTTRSVSNIPRTLSNDISLTTTPPTSAKTSPGLVEPISSACPVPPSGNLLNPATRQPTALPPACHRGSFGSNGSSGLAVGGRLRVRAGVVGRHCCRGSSLSSRLGLSRVGAGGGGGRWRVVFTRGCVCCCESRTGDGNKSSPPDDAMAHIQRQPAVRDLPSSSPRGPGENTT